MKKESEELLSQILLPEKDVSVELNTESTYNIDNAKKSKENFKNSPEEQAKSNNDHVASDSDATSSYISNIYYVGF
ncbi:unnamed protein product [Parnassius apollo]|uniref:(apollo) hypothetical protein n=1 Tax=Parnassius apollo TaxID=110799 RepID=A0A8S3W5T2_PARAO|nr:unnamed protein product [Parnassius apollo]